MPEDHGHWNALEFIDEDTVLAAGFAEWVWLAVDRARHWMKGAGLKLELTYCGIWIISACNNFAAFCRIGL